MKTKGRLIFFNKDNVYFYTGKGKPKALGKKVKSKNFIKKLS